MKAKNDGRRTRVRISRTAGSTTGDELTTRLLARATSGSSAASHRWLGLGLGPADGAQEHLGQLRRTEAEIDDAAPIDAAGRRSAAPAQLRERPRRSSSIAGHPQPFGLVARFVAHHHVAERRPAAELVHVAFQHDAPAVDDHDVAADVGHEVELVAAEQDGDAART